MAPKTDVRKKYLKGWTEIYLATLSLRNYIIIGETNYIFIVFQTKEGRAIQILI